MQGVDVGHRHRPPSLQRPSLRLDLDLRWAFGSWPSARFLLGLPTGCRLCRIADSDLRLNRVLLDFLRRHLHLILHLDLRFLRILLEWLIVSGWYQRPAVARRAAFRTFFAFLAFKAGRGDGSSASCSVGDSSERGGANDASSELL